MSNRYYVYGCKLFLLGCTDSYYTILSVLEDKWTFTAKKSFSLPYYSQSKVLRPNRQFLHRRCRCCCCKVLHRSIQEDRGLKKFVLAKVWGVSLGERERKRERERRKHPSPHFPGKEWVIPQKRSFPTLLSLSSVSASVSLSLF